MLNKERFYTMSGAEFERRYQEFIMVSPENIATAVNAEMVNIEPTRVTGPVMTKTRRPNNQQTTPPVNNTPRNTSTANNNRGQQNQQNNSSDSLENFYRRLAEISADNQERLNRLRESAADQPDYVKEEIDNLEAETAEIQRRIAEEVQRILREKRARQQTGQPVVTPRQTTTTSQNNNNNNNKNNNNNSNNNGRAPIPVVPIVVPTNGQGTSNNQGQQPSNNNGTTTGTTVPGTQPNNQEQTTTTENNNSTEKPSLWKRFKKSKVGKRVTALLVAASLLVGGIG